MIVLSNYLRDLKDANAINYSKNDQHLGVKLKISKSGLQKDILTLKVELTRKMHKKIWRRSTSVTLYLIILMAWAIFSWRFQYFRSLSPSIMINEKSSKKFSMSFFLAKKVCSSHQVQNEARKKLDSTPIGLAHHSSHVFPCKFQFDLLGKKSLTA